MEEHVEACRKLIEQLRPTDHAANVKNVARALELIKRGQVSETPCPLPLAVLRGLGKDASFKSNVAAVLSLTQWAELGSIPVIAVDPAQSEEPMNG